MRVVVIILALNVTTTVSSFNLYERALCKMGAQKLHCEYAVSGSRHSGTATGAPTSAPQSKTRQRRLTFLLKALEQLPQHK